jgi:hypothetical protein
MFDKLAPFGCVEGVEPDAAYAPREPAGHIYAQPFDESFWPDRRYGLITMLDVLEHLSDPSAALRHAAELLSADGTLVVTVPAFRLLWTSHDDLNHHLTRYTKGALRRLMDDADLAVLSARYLFHWTFAAKLLVRLKESVIHSPPSVPRVPPGWINRLLLAATRIEERLSRHVPLPLGSSLIVVARHKSAVATNARPESVTAMPAPHPR